VVLTVQVWRCMPASVTEPVSGIEQKPMVA
jgi:hypothetical protein